MQLSEMFNEKQVKDGHKLTAGHSYWFCNNPKWLILAWVAAGVKISGDHTVQKKMLETFWTTRQQDVLLLLQKFLPPTENFVHPDVQHICQAMPCAADTVDTPLCKRTCNRKRPAVQQLWEAGPAL